MSRSRYYPGRRNRERDYTAAWANWTPPEECEWPEYVEWKPYPALNGSLVEWKDTRHRRSRAARRKAQRWAARVLKRAQSTRYWKFIGTSGQQAEFDWDKVLGED